MNTRNVPECFVWFYYSWNKSFFCAFDGYCCFAFVNFIPNFSFDANTILLKHKYHSRLWCFFVVWLFLKKRCFLRVRWISQLLGTFFGVFARQLRKYVRYPDFQFHGRLSPRRFSGPPKSQPRFIIYLGDRSLRSVYHPFLWAFASSITVGRWQWSNFVHANVVLLDGTPGPIPTPRELPNGLDLKMSRRQIYQKKIIKKYPQQIFPLPQFLFYTRKANNPSGVPTGIAPKKPKFG